MVNQLCSTSFLSQLVCSISKYVSNGPTTKSIYMTSDVGASSAQGTCLRGAANLNQYKCLEVVANWLIAVKLGKP